MKIILKQEGLAVVKNVGSMNSNFTLARVQVNKMAAYVGVPGSESTVQAASDQTFVILNALETDLNNYITYLEGINATPALIADAKTLEQLIVDQYIPLAQNISDAALSGDRQATLDSMTGAELNAEIAKRMQSELDDSYATGNKIIDANINAIQNSIIVASVVLAVIIVIAIIIAIFFSNIIVRKLAEVSKNVKNIAMGDFENNTVSNDRDEIGELSRDMTKTMHIIQDIIGDIQELGAKQMAGNTSFSINSSKYDGAYALMVNNINSSFKNNVDEVNELLSALGEFSQGNFDVKIRQYQGEKVVINQKY